ncbi:MULTISPECIES: flagellar hook-associated protein FlgL [unclassified Janthinobacterium]|uniref:flagellar hook-associated protein FlgL n=1 Tax=unclassified Janthinobacterium TaxID=2610881 RepID=UPI00160D314C|nr:MULTISPECIES: flagellar hook-associated protein FlgL [unclassified Janthinobacterium]MBB5366654.1 flagellar hook-associated protein 3 FlgL [Janthinobacterium sp. K2C7]MBB5380868.1 flagellar hook-associated protein 3 FlgL [Janthinobacterium sp. K2Li3]MBB5385036.1 flagellar hook-associated protein 3 FlgL [Janthinobacterium sp. K2E3]
MRVASGQYQSLITNSLQQNQARIDQLTQQLASGSRIQLPSDDPIGNVRISRLTREQAMVTQYKDNIATVKVRLLKNENYLSSMVNDMGQARDLLVWAADGSNTSDDLKSMSQSLVSMRDSVLYTANMKDQEGRYMFSGTASDQPAIQFDANAAIGSRYTYIGNTDSQVVVVGNGVTQAANVDVKGVQDWLNKIDQVITALNAPGANANDPATHAVIASGIDGTDAGTDFLSNKIAILGGSQNILTTLDNNLSNVSLSNDSALNDLKQTDVAATTIDLNGYQTALQATYKTYAKVGNLSLFDVL